MPRWLCDFAQCSSGLGSPSRGCSFPCGAYNAFEPSAECGCEAPELPHPRRPTSLSRAALSPVDNARFHTYQPHSWPLAWRFAGTGLPRGVRDREQLAGTHLSPSARAAYVLEVCGSGTTIDAPQGSRAGKGVVFVPSARNRFALRPVNWTI